MSASPSTETRNATKVIGNKTARKCTLTPSFPTPQNGSSTYDTNGEIVAITIDSPTDGTEAADHYHVVAGYDQDGNGQLSTTEAGVVPKYKWKGAEKDYEVKLVSTSRYNSTRQDIRGWASSSQGLFPQASRLLQAFADEATPAGATSTEQTTVDRLEPGLDHPVGILFNANQSSAVWPALNNNPIAKAGPGASIKVVFGSATQMSDKVLHSDTIRSWLSQKLSDKLPDIRQDLLDSGELQGTYIIEFNTKNPNNPNKDDGLGFGSLQDWDIDLFLALNRVELSVTVTATVHLSGLFENIQVVGTANDLYDFNYDGDEGYFVKKAASVQAGYNTLGTGGRVYKSRIELNGTIDDIHL